MRASADARAALSASVRSTSVRTTEPAKSSSRAVATAACRLQPFRDSRSSCDLSRKVNGMSLVLTAPTQAAIKNSDDQLALQIQRQLASDSRAVSRLQIHVEAGVVTLRGTATSFYQKQLWLHGTKRVVADSAIIDDQIAVTPAWSDSDMVWRD